MRRSIYACLALICVFMAPPAWCQEGRTQEAPDSIGNSSRRYDDRDGARRYHDRDANRRYDDRDGERYGRYRDDPEWQAERQRRHLQRELRENEERRLYRDWLESSTVTCFQAGVPVITSPQALTIVPTMYGPWPQLSFSDAFGAPHRTLSLLSRTVSCTYQRHDRAYSVGDGTVVGGFQQNGGSSQAQGPQVVTCFRSGTQIAQEVLNNVALSWNTQYLRLDFTHQGQQADSVVIDMTSTGCIMEPAL